MCWLGVTLILIFTCYFWGTWFTYLQYSLLSTVGCSSLCMLQEMLLVYATTLQIKLFIWRTCRSFLSLMLLLNTTELSLLCLCQWLTFFWSLDLLWDSKGRSILLWSRPRLNQILMKKKNCICPCIQWWFKIWIGSTRFIRHMNNWWMCSKRFMMKS